jgi:hypothetical protein
VSSVTIPYWGRETSNRPSGAKASRRAFFGRAQTLTVHPAGTRSFLVLFNGAQSIAEGTETVVAARLTAAVGFAAEGGVGASGRAGVAVPTHPVRTSAVATVAAITGRRVQVSVDMGISSDPERVGKPDDDFIWLLRE